MNHTEYGHSITFIAQNWDKYPDFTHADLSTVGNYNADEGAAYDERKHLDRNTWESWGLIPNSRPTLPHPQQKTKILENDSINGVIDLSWSQVPYPLFGNREGSFTFIYNPIFQGAHNKYKPWDVLYSEISEFIHGRRLRMVLEDDPGYYYEGRFWVENWTSNTDGSGSTVTIGYSVEPYKMSILSSLNDWYWDPFNFYNGVITSGVFSIKMNLAENTFLTKEQLWDLWHNNDNEDNWWGKSAEDPSSTTSPIKRLMLFGLVGSKPQIPVIHWIPDTLTGKLIVNYVNSAYGIDYRKTGIKYKYFDPNGNTDSSTGVELISSNSGTHKFKDMDMVFSDNYMGEEQFIQFYGKGTVKIEFHRGDL